MLRMSVVYDGLGWIFKLFLIFNSSEEFIKNSIVTLLDGLLAIIYSKYIVKMPHYEVFCKKKIIAGR